MEGLGASISQSQASSIETSNHLPFLQANVPEEAQASFGWYETLILPSEVSTMTPQALPPSALIASRDAGVLAFPTTPVSSDASAIFDWVCRRINPTGLVVVTVDVDARKWICIGRGRGQYKRRGSNRLHPSKRLALEMGRTTRLAGCHPLDGRTTCH